MVNDSYIPYGRQDVTQEDIDAVIDVLRSDFLTQGPSVPIFEKAIADYCGVGYGVAVNSATSALHLACLSLGLGPGDLLWTTPITFVASANCALYCGAKVEFVDIDPVTYNLCPAALEIKLIQAEKIGRLPKIVVPVHLCGQSCDMQSIKSLAEKYKFKIIEDASHAIGAKYQNNPVGSCQYSDITILSFHPVKIITTGEGGMALTNDSALAESMVDLRSHGITRDPLKMVHEADGDWYYQQIALGFNYRMTDMQAALGVSQLSRLDDYVFRRHQIADRYNKALIDFPLETPITRGDNYSAFHLYVVQLHDSSLRKTVFDSLRNQGIGVNVHYIPVHMQPYHKKTGLNEIVSLPHSERYYSKAISLPMYPTLTKSKQSQVVDALTMAFGL
jgi:UDP-4-amino-4,6-dideoxy-N-acetyl-beta-L-altrosamine transaminase